MEPVAQTFRFCPRCGVAAETVGENPFRCSGCDLNFFFGPCTAVAGIICDRAGQVLFIKRQKDPGKGKLGLPGGFLDAGESIEDALCREVLEEINLQVIGMKYLASFPNEYTYRGVTLPVTDVFFQCDVESFDDIAAQESEVAGWHFCHPDASMYGELAFESHRLAVNEHLRRKEPEAN